MPVQINLDIIKIARAAHDGNCTYEEAAARMTQELRERAIWTRGGKPCHSGTIVLIDGKPHRVTREKCSRCGGAGGWKGWPGYTCFRCGGEGVEPSDTRERLYTADEVERLDAIAAKREATMAAKAARKAAEAAAKSAAILEALQGDARFVALSEIAGGNDFLNKMVELMKSGAQLTEKQTQAVDAAIERAAERKRVSAESEYVGAIGERVEIEGKVSFVRCLGPGYARNSSRYMIKATTARGIVVWFTEAAAPEVGSDFIGRATVKKHDTYNGAKQTIITRFAGKGA